MNNLYSLDADSHRWWWAPAGAGALCAVSIATVVVISTGNTATTADPGSGLGPDRPCFTVQPGGDTGFDGPQSTCS